MILKDLHTMGEKLFSDRLPLMSLFQEIGENFYWPRADFTASRSIGETPGVDTLTSYPELVRRGLGDSFSSMLRPTQKEWFHTGVVDEDFRADNESRRWLEWIAGVQRRAMYDPRARFTRATKVVDHDFVTFGQGVIECRENPKTQSLLYRSWHLRDVAWGQTDDGRTCPIVRKWKVPAHVLIERFGDRVHPHVKKKHAKDPFCEIDCRHLIIESDMWDGKEGKRTPYVSVYYDVTHDLHPMETSGTYSKIYVIPRWMTYESQYAISPATWAALGEAKLLQAMMFTLLEAGEKAVNPPIVAKKEVFRSDMAIYAGALTWADLEPDEKLSDALQLLVNDKSGIPLGLDMLRDARALISDAMYINKLSLPPPTQEMTAYEVGQRIEEYIRNAMPLFEPVETDYNAGVCDETFEILFGSALRAEARGIVTPLNIPRKLRGADIMFRFESPLHDAIEKQKGQQLVMAKQLLATVMDVDQSTMAIPDWKVAFRDALQGTVPAKWLRPESAVREIEDQQRRQQELQQSLAAAQQGAEVVQKLGSVAPQLAEAA